MESKPHIGLWITQSFRSQRHIFWGVAESKPLVLRSQHHILSLLILLMAQI